MAFPDTTPLKPAFGAKIYVSAIFCIIHPKINAHVLQMQWKFGQARTYWSYRLQTEPEMTFFQSFFHDFDYPTFLLSNVPDRHIMSDNQGSTVLTKRDDQW